MFDNPNHAIFRTAEAAAAMLAKLGDACDGERYAIEARGAVFVIALYDDVGLVGLI